MSEVDITLCKRCASKLAIRAQKEDGTWYDLGLNMDIKPWEQFPTEPRSAYQVFNDFCRAYPKELSLKELTDMTGYGVSALRHWSKRWRWKERFYEWARKCDKEALIEQADIRKEMNDRQAKIASDILGKALTRIERIDVDELSPREVVQWADVASKLERTAIEDNRKLVEVQVESKTHTLAVATKDAKATDDAKMQEVLSIMMAAGGLTIEQSTQTTLKTDKQVVEADFSVVEEVV
jgi:hypothetical protein